MKSKVYEIGGVVLFMICLAIVTQAEALTVEFDYSYDASSFFSEQTRKDRLEQAATYYEDYFLDDLERIEYGEVNTWRADFTDPSSGGSASESNLVVAADTLVVYVGARDLGGSVLGQAGPGGYWAFGTENWRDTIKARGETGGLSSPYTDFGPWGGSIAFDVDSSWYFGADTSGLGSGTNDFLSVAIHELGHVFGFGTANSWDNYVDTNNTVFTGLASITEYGGSVPLDSIYAHWANGTMSDVGGIPQETAMDPNILQGTRKYLTSLDYAGFSDVGWEVVPEPSTLLLLISGVFGLIFVRRRLFH